eukprot:Phypoly_transcript_04059.p3 GENE.Phypoly_transcript_04059~~Phypoly_transcript_04059.p3  ORF type:complete len:250 (-),score=108.81 Phypoly_transcript_04059:81-830(-)
MFSPGEDPPGLKQFYTEKELLANADSKKKQQQEAPANENRTLYDRLQENKVRMEEEFAEKVKFRAPKGLDQEDIDFFEERARKRLIREIENEEEDQSELEKVFRSRRVVKADEVAVPPPPVVVTTKKPSAAKPNGLQVKVMAKPKTTSSSSSSSSSSSVSSSSSSSSSSNPPTKRKLEEGEETSKAKKVLGSAPSSTSASTSSSSKPSSSSSASSSSKSSSSPPELGPAATANPNPLGGLLAYDEDDDE